MSVKCPKCGNAVLDSEETDDWGIDYDLFPPHKCSDCGWETSDRGAVYKDYFKNILFSIFLVFLFFLYFIWAFS